MTNLLGSSYTAEYVIAKCFPEVENVQDRVNCEILQLENAKSFWSLIARIGLKWKSDEDRAKYPASVFIKVPTVSSNLNVTSHSGDEPEDDSLKQTLIDLTANEDAFYKTMKNKPIPGFPYPRYYHGEEVGEEEGREGCLVLEDFTGQVAALDYIPGFTIPQVESLIDALASWHAFIFERPELTKDFEDLKMIDEDFQAMLFHDSSKLESLRPEWFEGRFAGIKKYFSIEYAHKTMRSYSELEIPPVLVHMDMNTTNILWRKESVANATPEIASIIDFQNCHTGNICEDIARILQIGVSADVRRENEARLLGRYHAKLEEKMGARNPVSLETVHAAYRRVFPFVANFALFAVTCYHAMYEDMEKDERTRAEKQTELLRRAKGIVDDVYVITNA